MKEIEKYLDSIDELIGYLSNHRVKLNSDQKLELIVPKIESDIEQLNKMFDARPNLLPPIDPASETKIKCPHCNGDVKVALYT